MVKEIPLTQGKAALVDDDDYEHFNTFKWFACRRRNIFYAERRVRNDKGEKRSIGMHRQVVNCPCGYQIDHIDGNGLNNCKSNLRIVTIRQNQQNLHIQKTSKYYGVTKNGNGWQSQINYLGRKRYIGVFKNEIDAHTAYLVAEKVLVGCSMSNNTQEQPK